MAYAKITYDYFCLLLNVSAMYAREMAEIQMTTLWNDRIIETCDGRLNIDYPKLISPMSGGFYLDGTIVFTLSVIAKRFEKYGLSIHPQKTRLVRFPRPWQNEDGERGESFDFLGFTHYWEKNGYGNYVVCRRTARTLFQRALKGVRQWCRENRHQKLREQLRVLTEKLQGHYAYYGIGGNYPAPSPMKCRVPKRWQIMTFSEKWRLDSFSTMNPLLFQGIRAPTSDKTTQRPVLHVAMSRLN